jgi:hypothetical protein
MAWYEVEGEDGFPRAAHGIKRLMPEGSKEISEAQAQAISEAVRAREPKTLSTTNAQGEKVFVDLGPLHEQISNLSKVVTGHAQTLDAHEAKIQTTETSVATYLQGVKDGGAV